MLHLPLAQGVLDRAAHLRVDESALEELMLAGIYYQFRDQRWVTTKGALTQFSYSEIQTLADAGELYFLGLESGQIGHFLFNAPILQDQFDPEELLSLRDIAAQLSFLQIGIAVHGQALALWHNSHRFCSRCGLETFPIQSGSIRSCSQDHQHHPRTDPAIIVLIRDRDDRIMLGHQATWPERRFSAFAGFVEPGESFESAVLREVAEESGIQVRELRYLGSQPWPFPASVMVAYEVIADNPEDARADGLEITELKWWTRAQLKSESDSGELILPPKISVARAMIDRWFSEKSDESLGGEDQWRN